MGIELRYKTYYAYLDVPEDVREKLKRRTFRKTLGTQSRAVAKRRAAIEIARWQREIEDARGNPETDDAAWWRDRLRKAATPEDRSKVLERIEAAAWTIGAENAEDITKPFTAPEAREFYSVATGAAARTDEFLDEWLRGAKVKDKTAAMRRSTIARLAAKFPTLRKITRPEVVRWVSDLQADLQAATVQRLMSDCRSYWQYLQQIEEAPAALKPFDDLGIKPKNVSWLPYTPEEAAKLFEAAADDQPLADLVRLAMFTGARREELCALRVEHVKGDRFDIVDAKTEAGIRTVPIHSRLTATIARLCEASADGYLMTGLEENANGDRGDAIGKRYGRLKSSLGFSERHSFHSWRGTVITMLERAGVPEGTTQDLVGHRRSTLTGQTYSGKSTIEMRREAIERLAYPGV